MRTRSLGLGSLSFTSQEPAKTIIQITSTASYSKTYYILAYNQLTATAGLSPPIYLLDTDTIENIVDKIIAASAYNGWVLRKINSSTIECTNSTGIRTNNSSTGVTLRPDSPVTANFLFDTRGRATSSDMYGYYGKYKGLATPNELISLAGITQGVTKNDAYNNPDEDITWLKFSHNYKTLFVADRTISRSVSWNHLDSKGLVFGKVVDIDGKKYLLRLLQGANVNPANVGGGANSNDEWDSLIVQFTPDTADSHWGVSDSINTAGGSYTICQETSNAVENCRVRGYNAVTSGFSVNKLASITTMGYRPVLEVLYSDDKFITDRTLQDVQFAFANQYYPTLLKGALNYQDFNRIEKNMQELAILLSSAGYYTDLMYKLNWMGNDIPYLDEINRIRDNLIKLIIKFVEIGAFPQITKSSFLHYTEVNNWERTTELMFEYFDNLALQQKYCGNYICGE